MQHPNLPATVQNSKVLRFGEILGEVNEDLRRLPLEVVIPANYELAHFPDAPEDYAYWMPPERVAAVVKSGDLPTDTGFLYTKVSLDVGYDATKGIFVGFEDRDPAADAKGNGLERFEWKRAILRGGYPAIFWQFQNPTTKRIHYSAYVATLYESITFYISYTPPDGDASVGEKTWDRFRSALTNGAK